MKPDQATSKPWQIGIDIVNHIYDANSDKLICICNTQGIAVREVEANARLIVKAVNCHDELVDILDNVNEFLLELERQGATRVQIASDLRIKLDECCIKAKQALAKAGA